MTTKKQPSFAQAYKELETIVTDFESRELDLEKDIPRFERGMELAHMLRTRLGELESTIKDIDTKFSGEES